VTDKVTAQDIAEIENRLRAADAALIERCAQVADKLDAPLVAAAIRKLADELNEKTEIR
jgi:hypothetical protein